MKLITRFIIIYLIVTAIVLGIGGVISFVIIKNEVDKELKWEFLERIDRVTYLLEKGRDFNRRNGSLDGDRNLLVRQLNEFQEDRTEVTDTLIWHDRLEQYESNVKVSAYRNINGDSYYISTHGAMIDSDDITEAVVKTLLWILGLQVIGAFGIGFFVSGRLFKPFRQTLEKIKNFKLYNREFIRAERTGVKEFDDLNRFVEKMTRKAMSDYKNLKEFAENASHELQTPLAIARGKLELLAETDLTEKQHQYVESVERTIKKLSRLSESLALLTKIENHEFSMGESVNLSAIITGSISNFKEFIELHQLQLITDVSDEVYVNMNPVLADILWTNLFQNAIKHNKKQGCIRIELTEEKLIISNTGSEIDFPPEELFERFRKADQNSASIGLGLAIIRHIADQNNLEIQYTVKNGWHRVELILKNVKTGELQI